MTVELSPDSEKNRNGRIIFFTSNLSRHYDKFLSIYIIFGIFSNPVVGCYDIFRNVLSRESLEIFILQTLAHMPLGFLIFLYF